MDVDSDSSSSSDCNDEEFDKFKQDELKKRIDVIENKVNFDCLISIQYSFIIY